MSTSSSTCIELLPSESSRSISPKLSWLHASSAYCDVEFSLNAASMSPRGPIIVGVAGSTDRKLDFKHQADVAADGVLGETAGMNFSDGPHPNPYKAIRSRPLRSFPSRHHRCQTYSHPPIQTLYSWNSEESSFELPQPTSPTRLRRSKQGRSWLAAFDPRFGRLRSCSSPAIYYLSLYFGFNLGLTLYNKSLLIQFPFPYTLSAIHALCGSIGSIIYIRAGSSSPPPRLNFRQTLILLAFSLLYTVNIIISNVSLGLVTVPFHQVVRASTPLFTILFSSIIIGDRSSHAKLIALIPVVAGVGFATYGDYYFTPWGFCLTLLGTILAALKTIYTNVLQAPSKSRFRPTPSKPSTPAESITPIKSLPAPAPKFPTTQPQPHLPCLTPLHLLHLLSPLAFIQTMLIAHLSGELNQVSEYIIAGFRQSIVGIFLGQPPSHGGLSTTQLALLIANGAMAFGLNVVSFTANKKVGAVSMTVAANVKQVLTILCAVALFNLTITPANALGIVLTLIGGAIYTAVELKERREVGRMQGRRS